MGRKRIAIVLVVIVLGVAVGLRWLKRDPGAGTEPAPTGSPERAPAALPVYTHRVEPQTLREEVTATGAIRAGESIDLVSELSAKVVALNFDEGTRVNQGDLLVKLDDSELRAQFERARVRVELARLDAERQRELLAVQGTSQQNYDAAINQQHVLQAEADLIRAQLEKTEIRAPFPGVIGLRYVSVGSYVNTSTRIASLQDLGQLKIDFSVAERYMTRISPGANVRVSVAGRAEPLQAELYAIEPQIDPATRTIQLRARADNPGTILPGAFATVMLTLQEIPNALLVPANAIVPGLNQQTVFVVQDGKAEPRRIQTGLRLARDVQIVAGLEPGAVVITSGQLQLQPGAAVRPVERPREQPAKPPTPPADSFVLPTSS